MPRNTSEKVPAGAMLLRTYAELEREYDAFAHGERNLLIVVGPPGTAESTAGRRVLGGDARFIEGGATPYRLYMDLYRHRDRPVVLDDADKVFRNRDGVFLLKLLTQTEAVKTLQWNSNAAEIRAGELPAEFTTTSRVLVVANSWQRDNPDIASIESRGHLYYFAPPFAEIHRHAKTFVSDDEVYRFVGDHLPLFARLDLRLYGKATEVKATGVRTGRPDLWQEYVRSHFADDTRRVLLELLRSPDFDSDHLRAAKFRELTGKSERTFYRSRQDLVGRLGEAVVNACQTVGPVVPATV